MVIVFASLLFALPTSVLLCLVRGLDLLQGSSLVLVALISIPTAVTSVVLLAQSLSAPRRYARRAAADLVASGFGTAQGWVGVGHRLTLPH